MLTFPLSSGAVLTVSLERAEMLGAPRAVSFYASRGELDAGLRNRLDAELPLTWSGPESELGALVRAALGDQYDAGKATTTAIGGRPLRPDASDAAGDHRVDKWDR